MCFLFARSRALHIAASALTQFLSERTAKPLHSVTLAWQNSKNTFAKMLSDILHLAYL